MMEKEQFMVVTCHEYFNYKRRSDQKVLRKMYTGMSAGVIARGRGSVGQSPLVKIAVRFGGAQPLNIFILVLLFKVFCIAVLNVGLYMVIEKCLIVDYN